MRKNERVAPVPQPQKPYAEALANAFALLKSSRQQFELERLGAERLGEQSIVLPFLQGQIAVKLQEEKVLRVDDNAFLSDFAAILIIRYLAFAKPEKPAGEWKSFADFAPARGYLPPFQGRVLGCFLATVGKSAEKFSEVAEKFGGEKQGFGDQSFLFRVLPQVPLIFVRYDGEDDGELGPAANVLFPDNIMDYLSVEDMVVAAELLLLALRGREPVVA